MDEIGAPVHYAAVRRGTPVYSSDGVEVGTVDAVLDNYREHIFDGVVFTDAEGKQRFADAPEVARTAERGVVLELDAEGAGRLGPPEEGHAKFVPNRGGRVARFFGGGWKRR